MSQITLLDIVKPERTAAQDIFDNLAEQINGEIQRRIDLHKQMFNSFWKNPDATPEQLAEAAGTRAVKFFLIAAENINHINNLAKLIGKELEDVFPAEYWSRPKNIQFNQDGSVTIS